MIELSGDSTPAEMAVQHRMMTKGRQKKGCANGFNLSRVAQ
jgi:hypothetical protein